MKRAIVTGANGFIGKALLQVLSQENVETIAIVRNQYSNMAGIENLPGVCVIYCEMDDIKSLPFKICDKKPVDVFFHLAWEGSSGGKRGDYHLQLSNVERTLDAVETAEQLGCSKFVGVGSLAELDVDLYSMKDGSRPRIVSCYGAAKLAAHYMSKAKCNEIEQLKHCWVYLSNVYGKGDFSSNFINYTIKLMLNNKPAEFTAGEHLYDFVSIKDAAWGIYCVGTKGKENTSYYVGSGHPTKLKNFIIAIRNAINVNIPLYFGKVPFEGVSQPMEVFSCDKLKKDTGYKAVHNFSDEIKELIPWIKQQLEVGEKHESAI